jgi:hypothetical protein
MFAVATAYDTIAPGITMTQFWEIAWETFFHNVHYGRKVSAITRTALGNTVRVEYDGKDFRFSIS